jgi:hypothetical protein
MGRAGFHSGNPGTPVSLKDWPLMTVESLINALAIALATGLRLQPIRRGARDRDVHCRLPEIT